MIDSTSFFELFADFPIYEDYYGDSGLHLSYPPYNVSAVLSSPTGQAIASLSQSKLNASKSMELRKQSQITCKRKNDFPSCKNGCLFDVSSNVDECETTDISSSHPEVCFYFNYFDLFDFFFAMLTYFNTKSFVRSSRNFKSLLMNNTKYLSIKFPQ